MKKSQHDGGYYYYSEQGSREQDYKGDTGKNADFGIKDIIAMIIAAFELVLPPLFMIFGVVLGIYFVLKFVSGF